MMNAQFPEDSPLHDAVPLRLLAATEDPAYYMLNAIYGQVPVNYPGILGKSDNEGADAIKQAVSGSLGVPVDYYVLVNLEGFKEIVDAMGGITVNINEPVAINGNTDAGIPPTDYLDPGPDQHLDGFHALWFARGRYGSDDYARMDRQRCTVDAIIDAANPMTLFRHYTDLVKAGKDVVYTDIPRELAPAFVELALKVKDAKTKSVVFKTSEHFNSSDPDFDWMQETVAEGAPPAAARPEQAEAAEAASARTPRTPAPTTRPTTSSPASERRFLLRGLGHVALDLRVDPQVVERPGDHRQHRVAGRLAVDVAIVAEVPTLGGRDHPDDQPDHHDAARASRFLVHACSTLSPAHPVPRGRRGDAPRRCRVGSRSLGEVAQSVRAEDS